MYTGQSLIFRQMLLHRAEYNVPHEISHDFSVMDYAWISAFAGHKKRGPVGSSTGINITEATRAGRLHPRSPTLKSSAVSHSCRVGTN